MSDCITESQSAEEEEHGPGLADLKSDHKLEWCTTCGRYVSANSWEKHKERDQEKLLGRAERI